ncbi:unnamed protein product [Cochlearia groenlandica]
MDYFEDLHVEAELNPGSIEEWLTIIQQGKKMDKGQRSDLSIKVKKHLSALGWLFSYAHKGKRRELRYKSPKGRWYYSLATACTSCLDDNSKQQLQIVAKSDLPCYLSNNDVLNQEEKKTIILEDCDVTCSATKEKNPCSDLIKIVPNVDELDQQQKELKGETMDKEKNHSSDFIEMVLKIDVSNQQQKKRRKISDGVHSSTPGVDKGETRPNIRKSMKKISQEKNGKQAEESLRLCRQDCGQDMHCDVCCVCHSGGDLLLCDGCPSAFHHSCIGLSNLPKEELWFCPCCCCNICGSMEPQENSKLMSCEQCQKRFHLKCLKEVPCLVSCRGWFCSNQCTRVCSALQKLLGCKIVVGEEEEEDLVWSLIRAPSDDEHYDNEQLSKLDSAVEILNQGFVPTKDGSTGKDLVEELVFKRDGKGMARGFYIVLIEIKNQPITVAAMRVDKDVAEIPLVVSVSTNKRIEMCKVLMDEAEKQMSRMGVCRLVLPAAEEVVTIWIEQFGFCVMESWERLELVKHGVVDFVGTVMCHKFIRCTD